MDSIFLSDSEADDIDDADVDDPCCLKEYLSSPHDSEHSDWASLQMITTNPSTNEEQLIKDEIPIFLPGNPVDIDSFWDEVKDPGSLQSNDIVVQKFQSNLPSDLSPIEIFQTLLDIEFFEFLADKTNKYAEEYMKKQKRSEKKRFSRVNRWKDTDPVEIQRFCALHYFMGLIRLPAVQDYWSKDELFKNRVGELGISFERFSLLNKFFQIEDSITDSKDPNKETRKMQFLLKYQERFTQFCTTSNVICIDETIAPYQGRFSHLAYCPKKPDRWGVKLICLCDSTTGFCLRMLPEVKRSVQSLNKFLVDMIKSLTLSMRHTPDMGDYFACQWHHQNQFSMMKFEARRDKKKLD